MIRLLSIIPLFALISVLPSYFQKIKKLWDFLEIWVNFQSGFLIFWLIIFIIFIWILGVVWNNLTISIWSSFFESRGQKLVRYTKLVEKIQYYCTSEDVSLDKILRILKVCYGMSGEFVELANKQRWWEIPNLKIIKIVENQLNNILGILNDLRSDLTNRLNEQQEILESAKSEVSKNIQWTTELDQVSELQRMRLDKQIEQFEELQSVLVKV